jgi:hypothetical protein
VCSIAAGANVIINSVAVVNTFAVVTNVDVRLAVVAFVILTLL